MISYIRGELCDIEEQKAIVDVNGVGYGIYMPQQALSLLPPMGQQVKIHTAFPQFKDCEKSKEPRIIPTASKGRFCRH